MATMTATVPKFNTTTATSYQTPSNPNSSSRKTTATPVIEDDDIWIKEFRRKIQAQAAQRQKEARQQAEEEFRTAIQRTSDPERAERVRREFEIALGRLEQLFRDEEEDLIQREKEVRSWSREGGLTVNAEMVREQEMIMQALGVSREDVRSGGGDNHRSANTPTSNRTGTGTHHNNPTSRWIPPAGTAEKDVPDRGRQRSVGSNHHHHPRNTAEASRGRRISNSSTTSSTTPYTSSTTYSQQYSQPTIPQPIPPSSKSSSTFFPDRRPINEEPHSIDSHSESDSEAESEPGSEEGEDGSENDESDVVREKGFGRYVVPVPAPSSGSGSGSSVAGSPAASRYGSGSVGTAEGRRMSGSTSTPIGIPIPGKAGASRGVWRPSMENLKGGLGGMGLGGGLGGGMGMASSPRAGHAFPTSGSGTSPVKGSDHFAAREREGGYGHPHQQHPHQQHPQQQPTHRSSTSRTASFSSHASAPAPDHATKQMMEKEREEIKHSEEAWYSIINKQKAQASHDASSSVRPGSSDGRRFASRERMYSDPDFTTQQQQQQHHSQSPPSQRGTPQLHGSPSMQKIWHPKPEKPPEVKTRPGQDKQTSQSQAPAPEFSSPTWGGGGQQQHGSRPISPGSLAALEATSYSGLSRMAPTKANPPPPPSPQPPIASSPARSQRSANVAAERMTRTSSNGSQNGVDDGSGSGFAMPNTRPMNAAAAMMTRTLSNGSQNDRMVADDGGAYSMPKPMNSATGRMGRTSSNGSQHSLNSLNGRIPIPEEGAGFLAQERAAARPAYPSVSPLHPGVESARQQDSHSPTTQFTASPLSASGLGSGSFESTLNHPFEEDEETRKRRLEEEETRRRAEELKRREEALMRREEEIRKREELVEKERQLREREEAVKKRELEEEERRRETERVAAEERLKEEERRREEEIRLAEERRIEDEKRREAERLAEEERLREEGRRLEAERLAAVEREREEERRRVAERLAAEERLKEEKRRQEEEMRLEEIKRREDEEKAEQIRLERVRRWEEDKRLGQEQRLAEQKRLEEERQREERRLEEQRQREEKRRQEKARQEEEERSAEEIRKLQEKERQQQELHKKYEEQQLKQQDEIWQKLQKDREKEEARKKEEESRKRAEEILGGTPRRQDSMPNVYPSGANRPMSGASTFSTASRASTASTSSTSSWASSRSNTSSATDYSTRSNSTATPHWQQGSSNTRQSPTSPSASRAPTGDSTNAKPAGWKAGASPGSASAAGSAGSSSSYSSSPLSEAEWRRRQEEQAKRQQEQFRRDSMKTEQEQQAKAARTTSKDQVQRAWQNYEVGWATLKDRPTLHFKTIPWPTLKVPTSPEDLSTNTIGPFLLSPHHSQAKSNRDRIKEQLLRWHPDRFEGKWMTKVAQSDKDMVKEAVGQVVRSLNELNTRENSPFA